MSKLTHFNQDGNAHMVDVADKDVTHRRAIACGQIQMLASTLQMIQAGEHKKGDVLGIARIAGIMAAKKTSDLIPLQVALLTIYDMCKAVDRGMSMTNIQLQEKLGGKSGHWQR